jgi:HPt (histidine-containing phosphotransfer) domain-containing protein
MNAEGIEGVPLSLDRSVLTQISGGDPAFERRILDRFRRSILGDVAALRNAVTNTDLLRVRHLAHSIKGASRTVGAGVLGNVSERIELAARQSEWNTISASLAELDDEIARVILCIDSMLAAETAPPARSR